MFDIMVILVFFLVISVNRRLFHTGSYSGISVIPVILESRRTAKEELIEFIHFLWKIVF